ncbi:MAG: 16S rRNA (guanine(527)-N(7))-methyltransferase RsmG [Pseudolabrys sp.]|nr:16S rRNA (guanine(527)-N(7))-methyltransferase RsmG [Pseudolabrys sp.]
MSVGADDVTALQGIVPVSHETAERLATFVALLRKWQPVENLVSPKTLPEIWRRHVADSAELVRLFPDSRTWLDLGSGAGFPGLVVALTGAPGTHVHLVESNVRKCAFLRTVIRATDAPATVHEGRVEAVLRDWRVPVDRISARALAALPELLAMAEPLMARGVPAAFHKGEDFRREVAEASQSFAFDLVEHRSRVGEGVILEITNLGRKPRQA